eukprot:364958-Chlamydomonas_euryale.AAC.7
MTPPRRPMRLATRTQPRCSACAAMHTQVGRTLHRACRHVRPCTGRWAAPCTMPALLSAT